MRNHQALLAFLVAMVSTVSLAAPGRTEEARLRVNIFPGSQNIALFVAQDKGLFAKRGLAVEIRLTATSQAQRDGLATGAFEIAQAGVDNAVYLVEVAKVDAVIVAGGGNGMNELYVRPEIHTYDDIRGKAVVVDAPNTAYAFLLYKMLALKGLEKGAYSVLPKGGGAQRLQAIRDDNNNVAAMLYPPWTFLAERDGAHSLGRATAVIGPYQADGVWVLRSWAKANADTLVKYLQSAIEAVRWAMDPAHDAEAAAILAQHVKIDPEIARRSLAAAVGPGGGVARDVRFDLEGFRTTLKLRAEFEGRPQDAIPAPEKYLDLSYYERALAGL